MLARLAGYGRTWTVVLCRVIASELDHLGLEVQHIPLPISGAQLAALAGVSNPYWQLDTYLLPVCQWKEGAPPREQEQEQGT